MRRGNVRQAASWSCTFHFQGVELIEPLAVVIGDVGKDVGEPSLRIDTVELCGLDQREHDRRALPAAVGTGEQPCLASERNLAVILPISGRMLWSNIPAPAVRTEGASYSEERRAWGGLVHVELTPGAVTILPASKLDRSTALV
jgi:hypothetical protein